MNECEIFVLKRVGGQCNLISRVAAVIVYGLDNRLWYPRSTWSKSDTRGPFRGSYQFDDSLGWMSSSNQNVKSIFSIALPYNNQILYPPNWKYGCNSIGEKLYKHIRGKLSIDARIYAEVRLERFGGKLPALSSFSVQQIFFRAIVVVF